MVPHPSPPRLWNTDCDVIVPYLLFRRLVGLDEESAAKSLPSHSGAAAVSTAGSPSLSEPGQVQPVSTAELLRTADAASAGHRAEGDQQPGTLQGSKPVPRTTLAAPQEPARQQSRLPALARSGDSHAPEVVGRLSAPVDVRSASAAATSAIVTGLSSSGHGCPEATFPSPFSDHNQAAARVFNPFEGACGWNPQGAGDINRHLSTSSDASLCEWLPVSDAKAAALAAASPQGDSSASGSPGPEPPREHKAGPSDRQLGASITGGGPSRMRRIFSLGQEEQPRTSPQLRRSSWDAKRLVPQATLRSPEGQAVPKLTAGSSTQGQLTLQPCGYAHTVDGRHAQAWRPLQAGGEPVRDAGPATSQAQPSSDAPAAAFVRQPSAVPQMM